MLDPDHRCRTDTGGSVYKKVGTGIAHIFVKNFIFCTVPIKSFKKKPHFVNYFICVTGRYGTNMLYRYVYYRISL